MSKQHKQSFQARVEVVGGRLAGGHPVANPPCLVPPSVCHKFHRLHRSTITGVENRDQIAMQPAELPRVLAPRTQLLFQLPRSTGRDGGRSAPPAASLRRSAVQWT
jgi:hypothetical protein